MASSLANDDTAPIVSQQVLKNAKATPKAVPHDAPILITSDKNVLVGACQVRLERCKLRLQSSNLQLEHDKLQYQKAVEGFENEQAIVGKMDEATLLDFLPLVREKSEYYAVRCDLQSRICAEEKKREKLQEAMEGAMAELQQAKKGSSDVDSKENRPEYLLPLGKSEILTLEELARSTQLLQDQLAEKDGLITIHEETIKIDAELFFQRSCIAREQNAKLHDMKQVSSKIPNAEANLLTERNDKIFSLDRKLARLQYENWALKAGSDALENRVDELTKKCETHRRRVERANNSRAYAWDRLNTVKAERDATEDKVNTLLDLNHIIASFKEQKQGLESFASILEKEKNSSSSVLEVPPLHDNPPTFQDKDRILKFSMAASQSGQIKEKILDACQYPSPLPSIPPVGEISKSQTPKAPNTDAPVLKPSDSPLEIDIEFPTSQNETLSKYPWGKNIVPPIRDEENVDGFPVFGHICEGIKGLVVWSAIFSSGAVIIFSVLLVGHGLVCGLK